MERIKLTREQEHAKALFQTGDSLKINAYAGTGKTATLMMLSQSTSRQGVYLAFNRNLADEARTKFPPSVSCRTTHQLAFRSTPDSLRLNRDKMFGTMNANYVSKRFNLEKLTIDDTFSLSPRQRGALILETLKKFQYSADKTITPDHVPVWGKMEELSDADLEAVQHDAVAHTEHLWQMVTDHSDPAPLGHDGYYKLWALSDPVIHGDFILLDECQDTNPAMLGVLAYQTAQIVVVGDRYQQIYGWRGAVNAMEHVSTKHVSTLTQSFRFGPKIAEAATVILEKLGEKKRISGNPDINSKTRCLKPDVVLCRSNTGVVQTLLQALDEGKKPYVIGGQGEILRLLKGVSKLRAGEPTDLPELFGFSRWYEVIEFSETEEGSHLAMLVRIVNRYGEDFLIRTLSDMHQSEQDADLVISTVHKAKGRQWPRVLIKDDFTFAVSDNNGSVKMNAEELRLFYVALTRAQLEVGIPVEAAAILGIKV